MSRRNSYRSQSPLESLGQPLEWLHYAPVLQVALVAVEELVGSLTDLDDDRPSLAGELGDEVLRHRGPVGTRLVLVVDQLWQRFDEVSVVNEDLVVISREPLGDKARVGALVILRVTPGAIEKVRTGEDISPDIAPPSSRSRIRPKGNPERT